MKPNRRHIVAGTIGIVMIGGIAPVALASAPSGVTVENIVKANLADPVNLNADDIKLRTKVPTDILVQKVTFSPTGGRTGWHHHPGVVLVSVLSGAVTVWDADCDSTTYGPGLAAGSAFTESGDDPLEVTSAAGAVVYATFVVPQVVPTPVFRVEAPVVSCVGTTKSDDDRH